MLLSSVAISNSAALRRYAHTLLMLIHAIKCNILIMIIKQEGFSPSVKQVGSSIVAATVGVYNAISENLLPTPAKSHYTFNLRDLSKVRFKYT
jgi:AAA+ lid domain